MHLVQTVCNRLVMPWSDKQGRGANHGLPIPAKSLLPCLALPISLHLPCPAMADTIPSQYLEMYWLSYTVSEAKWRDETRCVYAMTAMRLIKNSKCLQKNTLITRTLLCNLYLMSLLGNKLLPGCQVRHECQALAWWLQNVGLKSAQHTRW